MTVLLARLKQAGQWAFALAALVVAAAWAFMRYRRKSLPVDPVDEALARYERVTAVASGRAAVEIAAARAKGGAEREQLLDILRDEDEDRRNDRLIEAGRKLRGE